MTARAHKNAPKIIFRILEGKKDIKKAPITEKITPKKMMKKRFFVTIKPW